MNENLDVLNTSVLTYSINSIGVFHVQTAWKRLLGTSEKGSKA